MDYVDLLDLALAEIRSGASPAYAAYENRLAAVLVGDTVIGDVWFAANEHVLSDFPEIARDGLPVLFFAEIEELRQRTPEELHVIARVKRVFPTSRVIQ